MSEFLNKLLNADTKIDSYNDDYDIIHHGLAPLLALSRPSKQLQKASLLETLKRKNWHKKARTLFNELNKLKIKFIVFKGFAFTYLLYNNSILRPYSDMDILIDKKDYDAVLKLLVQLGYQQFPSRQGRFISFQNSFYDTGSPKTIIDLHWKINNRIEFHKHFIFNAVYDEALLLTEDDLSFKTLSLEDAFILGCFHYQAHRPEDRKHIWLYDLALIWQKMDDIVKQNCLESAKQRHQSHILLNTLERLQRTFVGCFDFKFNLAQTQSEATDDYLLERNNKFSDIKTRLKNIHGLKNKLKFLSEYVFQSRHYVKCRYKLKSKRFVYFYYPRMWIEDFLKLFK